MMKPHEQCATATLLNGTFPNQLGIYDNFPMRWHKQKTKQNKVSMNPSAPCFSCDANLQWRVYTQLLLVYTNIYAQIVGWKIEIANFTLIQCTVVVGGGKNDQHKIVALGEKNNVAHMASTFFGKWWTFKGGAQWYETKHCRTTTL